VFGQRRLRKCLLEISDNTLQLLQAAILLLNLPAQPLDFVVEIIACLIDFRKVTIGRIVSALLTGGGERVGANALQLVGSLPWHVNKDRGCWALISVHMTTAQVLPKVLLASKPVAGAAVAIGIWAHQGLLCVIVLLVHFALVAQETARVGEALDLVAARFVTFVRAVMFVHVFAESDKLA
jgi:hypothetical protein